MSEETKTAGLLLRTIAKILDFIIIAVAVELVPKAGFYAALTYLLIGDGLFDGGSLGKKLIGLRVVSADSFKPCSFRDSILRNGLFGIGFLFYKILWLGWIFVAIVSAFEFIILLGSKNRMRLGDEFARTIVIENPQLKQEA
ncbi:MAG: RDD family protein [Thermodesulfovibrionales bacterium]